MSLAITLCPLIPIPFMDFFLEPFLAKQMFSKTNSKEEGHTLFATKNDSFCLGCLWGIFSGVFFILKPLRIVRLFTLSYISKTFSTGYINATLLIGNGYVRRTHIER